MTLKTTLQTKAAETAVIASERWYMVYVMAFYNDGALAAFSTSINGPAFASMDYTTSPYQHSDFSYSDLVKIGGGFIGQLRRFQIYSPGAYQLDSSLSLRYFFDYI